MREQEQASRSRVRVDPARLARHVRALVGFAPRDETHPENLERAAAWIGGELAAAGGRVEGQAFKISGTTYLNVLAQFGPETRERIVVGAHYDAAGPYPGADDNASSVAGLIEMARLLGQTPPPVHLELAAFTLEEPISAGWKARRSRSAARPISTSSRSSVPRRGRGSSSAPTTMPPVPIRARTTTPAASRD